ncbi:beta-lactamase domain-containing protein 2 [Octopus bimaculoides]|uniref:Beta-lactamase-related domain-containing protein n=1 Tax=Octopus bimaculoides TaxID=37653 RepID=A0A0L8HJ73_OCTBM|nr:beta-lactamase domain-containing protein 2 [Octopus bimaculoides]|eukprot:XP_014771999.1 PREDICTED: beta-lactamase domain-containing protein 2-like [Octopus bimaculoides]
MNLLVIGSACVAILAIYSYYSQVRYFKNLPKFIDGFVDPRFKQVEDAFRQNVNNELELGGTFAAYYKGELVVDLWGGYANTESPWRNDTLGTIFSVSKGVAAILVAKFVEKGYIDYNQKVSHYWPEFAQNGKESITVGMLVSHQSGIIGFDDQLQFSLMSSDYDRFLSILAAQKPQWTPGTKVGYHVITYGLYIDALLAKADPYKRPIERIFREEISEPYGIDFFQGVPYEEQYRAETRIYIKSIWDILPYLFSKRFLKLCTSMWLDKDNYLKTSVTTFQIGTSLYSLSDRHIKRLPCSSFNGYATARGLAKLFGNIVNTGNNKEGDILSKSTVENIDDVVSSQIDAILNFHIEFGRGFTIHKNNKGQKTFCHYGFGGQGACGDKEKKLSVAYISNHLNPFIFGADDRYNSLVDAVYRSVEMIEKESA